MGFRINYALYEELDAEDVERAREVYRWGGGRRGVHRL